MRQEDHLYSRPSSVSQVRQPDQEVEMLFSFFREGRRERAVDTGIQWVLERLLVDSNFLFRIERDPPNGRPGTAYHVNGFELASRLSFFLWSSIPDDELLDIAERGQLDDTATLERQVRRMLADPKSRALVTNFAAQWLYVRNLRGITPDSHTFPEFDDNLREAFRLETELFIEDQLSSDRSVFDLLRANYTFVNERLARHYQIPNVYGNHFRRVTYSDDRRAGLLGQGGILAVTSYATRTSPVLRGKWLLENILGAPPARASTGCACAGGERAGRQTDVAAGADGAAPGEPSLCELPQDDGPPGLRARKTLMLLGRGAQRRRLEPLSMRPASYPTAQGSRLPLIFGGFCSVGKSLSRP